MKADILDKKYTSSAAASAVLVMIAGILSRGTGFIREIVFAGYFGINEQFDIYLTGTVVPFIINTSVYYIAQNYLIPLFYSHSDSVSEQKEIINENFKIFIVLSVLITLILLLLKSVIVEHYLWNASSETKRLAGNVFIITSLTIPFNAGYSVLAVYQQAKLKFMYPALLPMLQNLFVIITIISASIIWGIYSIPAGYLAGYAVQFLIIYMLFDGRKNIFRKFSLGKAVFKFNELFTVIILIEAINQCYLLIDRYFLNFVEPGGISALNYSSVLFNLPVSVLSLSAATVTFPVFSGLIELGDIKALKIFFYRTLGVIAGIFLPLSLIYYFFGDKIITIVFRRGSFTAKNTIQTYNALKMYSLSLVFYAGFSIIYKMMFSFGLSRQLLFFTISVFIIKIFFNFILVDKTGYSGLALSSSMAYIIVTVMCSLAVVKRMKEFPISNAQFPTPK